MLVIIGLSCTNQQVEIKSTASDPLPSWNNGENKSAILAFVNKVSDNTSTSFVAQEDRVAVFDNDGTLWAEQPMYFQLYYVMDRVKQLAAEHPEWKQEQPFKAVLEGDMETVMKSGVEGMVRLTMATSSGMPVEQFEANVSRWIDTAQHLKTGKLYTQMVYQPMLELLDYLRDNGFKTYIVSGGGLDFIRAWSGKTYGIAPEQVVGTMTKYGFENNQVIKLPEIGFINDKEGKPLGIWKTIGKRPIAAFGNSDGDLAMMQWTAAGDGERLAVYIHHDDASRAWAYDRDSHIGRLDKGLDVGQANDWPVVSMKNDWSVIFPD